MAVIGILETKKKNVRETFANLEKIVEYAHLSLRENFVKIK